MQAVTRYLNGVNAISLLTTHYDKVAEYARLHYQIIGLRDVDTEKIRRELSVTDEDGVAVIARHMNYGLYRVEGRSDCPRDALNICRMLSLKPEILKWWRNPTDFRCAKNSRGKTEKFLHRAKILLSNLSRTILTNAPKAL